MGKAWDMAMAEIRRGAKDLHNNIVPAFPAYAHGVDEPGTAITPGVQAEAGEEPKASFGAAVQRLREADATPGQEQGKGMEL